MVQVPWASCPPAAHSSCCIRHSSTLYGRIVRGLTSSILKGTPLKTLQLACDHQSPRKPTECRAVGDLFCAVLGVSWELSRLEDFDRISCVHSLYCVSIHPRNSQGRHRKNSALEGPGQSTSHRRGSLQWNMERGNMHTSFENLRIWSWNDSAVHEILIILTIALRSMAPIP